MMIVWRHIFVEFLCHIGYEQLLEVQYWRLVNQSQDYAEHVGQYQIADEYVQEDHIAWFDQEIHLGGIGHHNEHVRQIRHVGGSAQRHEHRRREKAVEPAPVAHGAGKNGPAGGERPQHLRNVVVDGGGEPSVGRIVVPAVGSEQDRQIAGSECNPSVFHLGLANFAHPATVKEIAKNKTNEIRWCVRIGCPEKLEYN